ncbi:single-stranded DNA-binding protein [Candidatus Gracilibacteria bacterium 28_42_T64]|nr:single-stranded DNA-binding protein [Candidatus Gracilibacteria bacterium 28_42_T64]
MLNRICLIGNIVKDSEVKTTSNDNKYLKNVIAINKKYKNRDGEEVKTTTFINLTIWGQRADFFEKYIPKGTKVYLEGELENSTFDKEDGNKSYFTSINVQNVEFAGASKKPLQQKAEEEITIEDIPF